MRATLPFERFRGGVDARAEGRVHEHELRLAAVREEGEEDAAGPAGVPTSEAQEGLGKSEAEVGDVDVHRGEVRLEVARDVAGLDARH